MRDDPRVGTELAGYRILSVIGGSGLAVVYLVEHVRLGRKAALKVLDPEVAEDEAFRERFIRESRIAAGLDHPSVVTVYDAGEAEGLLYISMRYVEGTDLERLLRAESKLEPARAVSIVSQCAGALDAAHALGLVHRDVKPADILLEPGPAGTDRPFLSDFGMSRDISASTRLTRTGSFVGTVDYVAPEQIRGEDVDGRADVYSLGCVLYRCLIGEVPFPRRSELVTIYAHLNDPPPRPHEHDAALPSALDPVIERALAKSRDDRYATCAELAAATSDAVGTGLEVSSETEPEVEPLANTGRSGQGLRRVLSVGIAVLAVMGFAGLVYARSFGRTRSAASPAPRGQVPVSGLSGPFVIAAAGEIACPGLPYAPSFPDACQYDDTASLLRPGELTAVLALGDNQYDFGTYRDYLAYYDPSWGKVKPITKPVPGDREYGGDPTATPDGYFHYFGESAKGPQGEGYYSYNLPGGCKPGHGVCWHFIALNAELCMAPGGCEPTPVGTTPGLGNQMYRWLKHDLAKHPNARYRCTLAYWHQPLFSFPTGSGETPAVKPLWDALYAARADVVLNGQSHNYQRWRPQNPDGASDPRRGIREFVVGTGGSSRSPLPPGTWPANLVQAQGTSFGILTIALKRAGYRWEWVTAPRQPVYSDTSTSLARCA